MVYDADATEGQVDRYLVQKEYQEMIQSGDMHSGFSNSMKSSKTNKTHNLEQNHYDPRSQASAGEMGEMVDMVLNEQNYGNINRQ